MTMRRVDRIGFLFGLIVLSFCGIVHGAADFWLTPNLDGTVAAGNTISVVSGDNFSLNCYMSSSDNGSLFDVFLGFDVSDSTSYGTGGNPTLNKIQRISTLTEVSSSIDAIKFDATQSAITGTAREDFNSALGGRPYGLSVKGGSNVSTALDNLNKLFSITLKNNMAPWESYAVVISDAGTGTSWTTAWKKGITSYRDGYVLYVNSIPEPATLSLLIFGALALLKRRR